MLGDPWKKTFAAHSFGEHHLCAPLPVGRYHHMLAHVADIVSALFN